MGLREETETETEVFLTGQPASSGGGAVADFQGAFKELVILEKIIDGIVYALAATNVIGVAAIILASFTFARV